MRDYVLHQADQQFDGFLFPGIRRFLRNWMKRRMLKQVSDLDDYMLKDIGLTRDDLGEALNLPLALDPIAELHRLLNSRRRQTGYF